MLFTLLGAISVVLLAVFDFNHTIGLRGDFWVVRYHDNRMPFGVQLVDNFHHVFATARIQRTSWFIGNYNFTIFSKY